MMLRLVGSRWIYKFDYIKHFMNKRGQQMTLGTIIAIVLGIAVLVFLIFGFSTGWGNLWDKVTNFGGGKVNVEVIIQSCTLACQQNNEYSYCSEERMIRTSPDEDSKVVICKNLKNMVDFEGCSFIDCPRSSSSERVVIE